MITQKEIDAALEKLGEAKDAIISAAPQEHAEAIMEPINQAYQILSPMCPLCQGTRTTGVTAPDGSKEPCVCTREAEEAEFKKIPPPPLCCNLHPLCEHREVVEQTEAILRLLIRVGAAMEVHAKRVFSNDLGDGVKIARRVLDYLELVERLGVNYREAGLIDQSKLLDIRHPNE